jgi:hypothetical protein
MQMDDTPSTSSSAGCAYASSSLPPAHGREVVGDARGHLVVHDGHGLDGVEGVLAELPLLRGEVGAVAQSLSTTSTSKPGRCCWSIHSRLNCPMRKDTMRSPGNSVLVSALSHVPVPVIGIRTGVPVVVLKIFTSLRRTLVSTGMAGER